jgi:hypothetical protein
MVWACRTGSRPGLWSHPSGFNILKGQPGHGRKVRSPQGSMPANGRGDPLQGGFYG